MPRKKKATLEQAERPESAGSDPDLKGIVDGTILLAIRSIVEKAKGGRRLTSADLKVLKELRVALDSEEDGDTDWDKEWRKYKALLAKIEYDVQRGKYVPSDAVIDAWINRYAHIKRYLILWPKRLCGILAHQPEGRIMEILEKEIHDLLTALARPGRFCPEPNE